MSEIEQRLVQARLELVEVEIARLEKPKDKESFWVNPIIVAVFGATATAIVGLVSTYYQASANRQLERNKLESTLILKAVESNPNNSYERLIAFKFFVKAGLVSELPSRTSARLRT